MELVLVYIFAFFNLLSLFWYVRHYGISLSPGFIILSFYVLVACLAVPAYGELPKNDVFAEYNFKNITLFPYIVYFLVSWQLIKPTFGFQRLVDKAVINYSPWKVRVFSYLYILSAIVTSYLMYRTITVNSMLENMAQVRMNLNAGEEMNPYNSVFEHLFVTFTMSFQYPAIVIFFILLTSPRAKKNKIFMIIYAFCIFLPTFFDAVRTASRGMVVSQAIILLICYGLFKDKMPKIVKRLFYIIWVVLLIIFVAYSLLVTAARFGDSNSDTISSLICYWGQPTLIFNSQVMDVDQFASGKIFFRPLYEMIGIDNSALFNKIRKGFGTCFITAIGTFYLDYGIVGIIILAIIIPACLKKILYNRASIDIANLYLIIFYCQFLQKGALTMKWGYFLDLLNFLFFYFVVKLFSVRIKKNNFKIS